MRKTHRKTQMKDEKSVRETELVKEMGLPIKILPKRQAKHNETQCS